MTQANQMNQTIDRINGLPVTVSDLEPVTRLSRDLSKAAKNLTDSEARFMVDAYYMMQENRKAAYNQVRSLDEANEPCAVLSWLGDNQNLLENQIKRALDSYTDSQPIGQWMRSITGIGPVISAGLIAHVDISRCQYAQNLWSFAGLNPAATWEKGQKRPWNATLKTLCWKIGESFVKVSGNEKDFYGKHYLRRKEVETHKNNMGEYAEQAAAKLAKFKIGKDTEAYKYYSTGKLPPAHIHSRAKRWAVKLFLSHYYEVYRTIKGLPVARPYAFQVLQHDPQSYIAPPNWDGVKVVL